MMEEKKTLSKQFIELKKNYKNERRKLNRELKQLQLQYDIDKAELIREAKSIKTAKGDTKNLRRQLRNRLPSLRIEEENYTNQEVVDRLQAIRLKFSTYKTESDDE